MLPDQSNAIVPHHNDLNMPDEFWLQIFQFLDSWKDKQVSEVSRHMLTLWRRQVLGLHIVLPPQHPMGFLREARFNTFPGLRFVEAVETNFLSPQGGLNRARELALSQPAPNPGVFVHLHLSTSDSLREASDVMQSSPQLAGMVKSLTVAATSRHVHPIACADIWNLAQQLPQLACLEISAEQNDTPFTDDDLRRFISLNSLRQLKLYRCQGFTGEGLDSLALSPLQSLSLDCCETFQGANLGHLIQTAYLNTFALAGCSGVHNSDLVILSTHPGLKHLKLFRRSLNLETLSAVGQPNSSLEALTLQGGSGPNLDALKVLQQMPNLKRLSTDVRLIESEEAVHAWLAKMPALTELEYGGCMKRGPAPLGVPVNAQRVPIQVRIVND